MREKVFSGGILVKVFSLEREGGRESENPKYYTDSPNPKYNSDSSWQSWTFVGRGEAEGKMEGQMEGQRGGREGKGR